ncbi:AAA family ATPase [Undibacterium sp. RTI2.1]|uniref:McrB family protein n=1 Tax=unclassified Undibacterium TaxID=2630295 RepID=UPI002B2268D8|nr:MULTISPECIES: AAA family ATPase [unclassified Undibacterium]MEB0030676.1 AAA family ATPase [Undibacterium sp. RTI2.1]
MIETIRAFVKDEAEKFGAKGFYIERNNTMPDALKDDGAYFGFIHPSEEKSGPFHDFSFTIFPNNQNKAWLICLGVGSSGFKNDYELATYPGPCRFFSKLIDTDGICKSDFSDIESSLPRNFLDRDELAHIKKTLDKYRNVLPVAQIVKDPNSDDGKKRISSILAGYAKLRNWPTNDSQRKAVSKAIKEVTSDKLSDDKKAVSSLLSERKYVVLQGAPGTGKTRLAKNIAAEWKAKTFFTQFHAETSYSDFIYGIRPKLDAASLAYSGEEGVLLKAIKHAQAHPNEPTILIIDEINRANLSNVLGPLFYLFEYKQDFANVEIALTPEIALSKIPSNLYVIATMNTADRSLAVVDFALRRRFAWYDLKPQAISSKEFHGKHFAKFEEIFNWYASSTELALQPGQGYFLAQNEDEMKNRIRYELFQLMREYLQEGLLSNAKEELNSYFVAEIGQALFE